MIAFLGGLLLAAAPSITMREAGIAGLLPDGPTPVLVDVEFGDLDAGPGVLELAFTNTDGDTVQQRTNVSILPGANLSRWMIVTPPDADTPLQATLTDETGVPLSTSSAIAPSALASPLERDQSLILLVGTDRGGLETLEAFNDQQVTNASTRIAMIEAFDLPDVQGALGGVQTIIWSDGAPPEAKGAEVVLDAVRSGAHLLLLPPALGAPWGEGAGNLTTAAGFDGPPTPVEVSPQAISHLLDVPAAGDGLLLPLLPSTSPWTPVLEDASGQPIVIRRPHGFGQITVSALDPSRLALAGLGSAAGRPPRADLERFWGATLARRDLPSLPELDRASTEERFRHPRTAARGNLTDALPTHWLARSMRVSGRLITVTLFALVWVLVAGGLLWRLTNRRGRHVFVWPALGGLSLAFALVAWALGSVMMPSETHVRHVTVLDHVSGTPLHRARSWIDLQLPGSGNRQIDLGQTSSHWALLRHWQPQGATAISFGDSRRLPLADRSDALVVAARDATSRMHLDWTGLADPEDWGRVLTSVPDDRVRVEDGRLKGSLVNRLPLSLHNVSVIWIQDRLRVPGAGGDWLDPLLAGRPLVAGQWWGLAPGTLLPGESIDLSLTRPSPESDLLRRVFDMQRMPTPGTGLLGADDDQIRNAMELLSVWSLTAPRAWAVPPPPRSEETAQERRQREAPPQWNLPHRMFGRSLDLGPWLASEAIIVLAWVEPSELPVDLRIDGEAPDAQDGRMLIRWILPLTDSEAPDSEPT
ncbi:MAG: hypothetical protein MK101_10125 [Phycisphaerales bacterium]|nr:hypothetical protein [Phycisphaerales bacterium]